MSNSEKENFDEFKKTGLDSEIENDLELPNNTKAGVPVHQDAPYNKHMSNSITCWTPLVETDGNSSKHHLNLNTKELFEPLSKD